MKTPLHLKVTLAITFALCLLAGLVLADNKNLKFGNGGQRSYLMLDTNLFATFGSGQTNETVTGISNAAVVTTVVVDTTAVPCPNTTGTPANIAAFTIPNNALENTGDSITFNAAGTMPTAQANTNELVFIYGSTTVLDTGLQFASNCTYTASMTLTRTAAIGVLARANVTFGSSSAGLVSTNVCLLILETNTVDTVLKFQGTSRRAGSMTNLFVQLEWKPTGK